MILKPLRGIIILYSLFYYRTDIIGLICFNPKIFFLKSVSEKNRIPIDLNDSFIKINASSKYTIINLSPEIIKVAAKTKFYELHDRLIVSTAKWLKIAIISSDKRFEEIEGITVIWDEEIKY